MTHHPGWFFLLAGLVLAVIGVAWLLLPSIPWLGKLPGDIRVEGEHYRFYFPIVTCALISLLLTGIMWMARFFMR